MLNINLKRNTQSKTELSKWNKYFIYFESYILILFHLAFLGGNIFETNVFLENLKNEIFYSSSQIFRKYNHQTGFLYNDGGGGGGGGGYVGKIVCQFFGLGSVCYWVCLFLGWWLCLVFGLCVC